MNAKLLAFLALVMGAPLVANAAPETFYVEGTFLDGGTLDGWFTANLDCGAGDLSGAALDITTSAGTTLSGNVYTGVGGCSSSFNGAGWSLDGIASGIAVGDLQLYFTPIISGPGMYALSGLEEQFIGNSDVSRNIGSGEVSSSPFDVPEPATFELLGLAIAGLGIALSKRKGKKIS